MRTVTFMNAMAASDLTPDPSNAMISISDAPGWGDPGLPQSRFDRLLRIYFVDGHYSGETICDMGRNFKNIYSAYFDRQRAYQIREFLDECDVLGIQNLYVHCTAGRSRSAAVALWASRHHGYALKGDPKHANDMVLDLLSDPHKFDHLLIEADRESLRQHETNTFGMWWKKLVRSH